MPIRAPQVALDAGATPQVGAAGVVPFQDQTGGRLQRLGGALSTLGQVGVQIQEENDVSAAKQADALFADAVRKAAYDPETGYLNQIGQGAIEGRKTAQETLDRESRRIGDSLQTTGAKARFTPALRQRMSRATEQFDRHYADQSRIHAIGAAEARLRTLASDYITALEKDPDQASVALGAAIEEARDLAGLRGLVPEEAKELELDVTTGFHEGAITTMLDRGLASDADHYFNEMKDEIARERHSVIQGKLKTANLADRALRRSTETMAGARRLEAAERTMRASELHAQGQTVEAQALLDPDYDPHISPDELFLRSERVLRRQFEAGKISAEEYHATLGQVGRDVKLLEQGEMETVEEVWTNMVQWLEANPLRGIEEFPDKDILVQTGKWPQAQDYARNGRVVTNPMTFIESLSFSEAQYQQMTDVGFRLRYAGKLEDKDMRIGLAKLHAAHGNASKAEFTILRRNDLDEKFMRDFGIDKKEDPDTWLRMTRQLDTIARAANLGPDPDPLVYEEKVLKVAARKRVFAELTGTQAGIKGLKEEGIPMAVLSEEQQATATLMALGQEVKLSDLTTYVTARYNAIAKQKGIPTPLSEQTIAEWWVAEDKPRPYAAVPGEVLNVADKDVTRDVFWRSDKLTLQDVLTQIPDDVRRGLIKSLRMRWQSTGINPGGMPIVDQRPTGIQPEADAIWKLWNDRGRPMTASELTEKK